MQMNGLQHVGQATNNMFDLFSVSKY